jgi:hypothetical protein
MTTSRLHINEDKRVEAYGGGGGIIPPQPRHPIHTPTVGKLIGPHDREVKYSLQADLRKADRLLLSVSASESPGRGLLKWLFYSYVIN